MTLTLFSTPCSINSESYVVSICLDHRPDTSLTLDQLLANDTTNDVLRSLRLQFSRSSDETILFDRLLSVQLAERAKPESKVVQVHVNYADVSESLVWTVEQEQLEMDLQSAHQFVLIVTKLLSKFQNRPKNLLVFVNPQCGKGKTTSDERTFSQDRNVFILGKAKSVYDEKVLPLFEEARISVKTIYTERANHAQDYVEKQSISLYDGLICVGGDGIFSELCHGLLSRTARQNDLNLNDPKVRLVRPKLRIGVIPAGSTDAAVFGTTGHNDPVTSALQIILGESVAIDITTVGDPTKSLSPCHHRRCVSLRFITRKVLSGLWQRCSLTVSSETSSTSPIIGACWVLCVTT